MINHLSQDMGWIQNGAIDALASCHAFNHEAPFGAFKFVMFVGSVS